MPPVQRLMSRDDLWLDRVPKLVQFFKEEAEKKEKGSSRWKKVGNLTIPVFWPSSISDCPRKISYDFRYPATPGPVDNEMLMADGEVHEAQTAIWLEKMGFTLDSRQKRVRKVIKVGGIPKFALHGKLDGILRNIPPAPEISGHPNKEPYDAVWECKGLSTFTVTRKNATESDIVYPHYRDQTTLYMYLTDLKNTIFTIKDKNNSKIRFIEWFQSEHRLNRLIKKGLLMAKKVKAKKLAPRAYDSPDAKPCSWCRHKKECWG